MRKIAILLISLLMIGMACTKNDHVIPTTTPGVTPVITSRPSDESGVEVIPGFVLSPANALKFFQAKIDIDGTLTEDGNNEIIRIFYQAVTLEDVVALLVDDEGKPKYSIEELVSMGIGGNDTVIVRYNVVFRDEDSPANFPLGLDGAYDKLRRTKYNRIADIEDIFVTYAKGPATVNNVFFDTTYSEGASYHTLIPPHGCRAVDTSSNSIYVNTWNHLFSEEDEHPDMAKYVWGLVRISGEWIYQCSNMMVADLTPGSREAAENWAQTEADRYGMIELDCTGLDFIVGDPLSEESVKEIWFTVQGTEVLGNRFTIDDKPCCAIPDWTAMTVRNKGQHKMRDDWVLRGITIFDNGKYGEKKHYGFPPVLLGDNKKSGDQVCCGNTFTLYPDGRTECYGMLDIYLGAEGLDIGTLKSVLVGFRDGSEKSIDVFRTGADVRRDVWQEYQEQPQDWAYIKVVNQPQTEASGEYDNWKLKDITVYINGEREFFNPSDVCLGDVGGSCRSGEPCQGNTFILYPDGSYKVE
jgi:hypothetical protein